MALIPSQDPFDEPVQPLGIDGARIEYLEDLLIVIRFLIISAGKSVSWLT